MSNITDMLHSITTVQGRGRCGQLSKHSPTSLQIWWVRLALLLKLRQFSTAEAEAAAFGDLDTPDLYYQVLYCTVLHCSTGSATVPDIERSFFTVVVVVA